jgi:hypothetical protein
VYDAYLPSCAMKTMLHRRKTILFFVLGLAACGADDSRNLTRDDAGDSDSGYFQEGDDWPGWDNNDVSDAGDDVFEEDTGTPIVCLPNNDGTIERSEVPVAADLRATFKIATDATFDTRGTTVAGETTWDLSGELENDGLEIVELKPLTGKWFETTFPAALYYSKISTTTDLLGVFGATDTALNLLGVVSPAEGFTKTELTYSPVVAALKFPLSEASSWTTNATVRGTASGISSLYTEKYTSIYAGSGKLITPYGTFEVIRVRTDLERTIGLLVTKVRTYSFVAECFGTVAVIRSTDNESAIEFTNAAEIRRLAP